ncbi:TetR/AcrR family transcriptional regulator [Bizionia arctica]|uniref:TetR family transcriptional regulator n=1 Tax=Bizionia arctica TaxID=1495645 RepID=A0A917LL15_9FLAO|nr:TetR/AcrR family transcriptional regulator [Bizionia arctica]GGG38068.1 TetR family transcriptional regulator [Bizionia arctica]
MITKQDILKCSIENFTKFGSKQFTLDELASKLGISKKTIYQYFDSKQNLVTESLIALQDQYMADVHVILEDSETDAIEKIIITYKRGLEYLIDFKPSFLFGIKKYYPEADIAYTVFSEKLVRQVAYNLLLEAQENKLIKPDVNIDLISELYLFRVDHILFKQNNLFEKHSLSELLKHLIIFNLRGITVSNYSNAYFE